MQIIDVVIAAIVRDGKVLIAQRRANDSFAGFWEFPGGKREPGESIEKCLARELREELAVCVNPIEALSTIEHEYEGLRVHLHPYLCTCEDEPKALASQRLEWASPVALRERRFPEANATLIEELIARLTGSQK
jgi:mutator protein MutT